MPTETWTLLDADNNIQLDDLLVTAADVPGTPEGFRVQLTTLRGGLRDGVQVLEVDNGGFGVALVPQRGLGIRRAWHGETHLGWHSPVRGPVHPNFVPLMEPGGLGWLDGFDELLVRCGMSSNGAPEFNEAGQLMWPLHGCVANLPAQRLEVSVDPEGELITISGSVDENRFHFQKLRLTTTLTLRFGESRFDLRDEVENLSANPGSMQMLYHINFGAPLAQPGSKLICPVKEMCPREPGAAADIDHWADYRPHIAEADEQVYFFDLHADENSQSRALLRSPDGNMGASVLYNTQQLPCFSQWKNERPEVDGYVTGLEPATNFPNVRSFEEAKGRVVPLAPGARHAMELSVEFHENSESVSSAEAAVAVLQEQAAPIVHPQPKPDWAS